MPDLGEDEYAEPLRSIDWVQPEPIKHSWHADLGRRPTLADVQHAVSLAQGIGVPLDASAYVAKIPGTGWEARFSWETDPLEGAEPRSRTAALAESVREWVAARRAR
jgi:hypothetical protein